LQPSLACEHEYGRLQLKGLVMLDDGLFPAIAHSMSSDTDFEYVICGGYGTWTIEALLERAAGSEDAEPQASHSSTAFGRK
jgi:hypothetical protein